MQVKQTQDVRDHVWSLFDVPVTIEIATQPRARKTFPIAVASRRNLLRFPADSEPLMVLFDQGDKILKSVEFKKDASAANLSAQKRRADISDRADAAVALAHVKDDPDVVAALGEAAQHDPFWGIRSESLKALGKIGGPEAEKLIIACVADEKPWVRVVAVEQLGEFADDASLGLRLTEIAKSDSAYRVRAGALNALGEIKASSAYDTLVAAVDSDSPDDTLRNGGLRRPRLARR